MDKKFLGLLLPPCGSVSHLHSGSKKFHVPGFTGEPRRPAGRALGEPRQVPAQHTPHPFQEPRRQLLGLAKGSEVHTLPSQRATHEVVNRAKRKLGWELGGATGSSVPTTSGACAMKLGSGKPAACGRTQWAGQGARRRQPAPPGGPGRAMTTGHPHLSQPMGSQPLSRPRRPMLATPQLQGLLPGGSQGTGRPPPTRKWPLSSTPGDLSQPSPCHVALLALDPPGQSRRPGPHSEPGSALKNRPGFKSWPTLLPAPPRAKHFLCTRVIMGPFRGHDGSTQGSWWGPLRGHDGATQG